MNLAFRLKAALKSFVNPVGAPKLVIRQVSPEPSVVIDNQLLAGKNVLITGAGQNIGRSIALEMAKQGANIFFTDIINQSCTKVEKELNNYSITARGFCSDISNIESIDSLLAIFIKENIQIDILVNNVGITTIKNFDFLENQKVFDTNVFGPMYLTKSISERMIGNNICGSIIFITSIHQYTVRRLWSYSASKAALGMMIKELAIELAPHQIRVNGIAPGFVKEDAEGNSLYHRFTPLSNGSINPHYIGRAAVYLGSDYFSQCTTGTVIKIDAGLSLSNYLVENSMR